MRFHTALLFEEVRWDLVGV